MKNPMWTNLGVKRGPLYTPRCLTHTHKLLHFHLWLTKTPNFYKSYVKNVYTILPQPSGINVST